MEKTGRKKIAVAGTGYVGLSLAVLLSQHNDVTAVDIIPEKVEQINRWESPIQDDYIELFMKEHEERKLSLTATTDGSRSTIPFPLIYAITVAVPKSIPISCPNIRIILSNFFTKLLRLYYILF